MLNTWNLDQNRYSDKVIFLPGPVAGALTDRFGCRPVALVGAFMGTAGLVSTIFTTQPWHLYLSFGVITGWLCYSALLETLGNILLIHTDNHNLIINSHCSPVVKCYVNLYFS